MTLNETLNWVISSGGAGALAYWLVERVPWLVALAPQAKRFVSFALTAVLAMLAYVACVVLRHNPMPAEWREWVEVLAFTATTAILVSQGIHGAAKLGKT